MTTLLDFSPEALQDREVRVVAEGDVRFGELMDLAGCGLATVIFRDGRPFAMLSPCATETGRKARHPGGVRGDFWMADDFDAPVAGLADAFERSST